MLTRLSSAPLCTFIQAILSTWWEFEVLAYLALGMGVIVESSQVLVYHLAPLVLVKLPFQQQRGSARGRTHRVRGRISLGRQAGSRRVRGSEWQTEYWGEVDSLASSCINFNVKSWCYWLIKSRMEVWQHIAPDYDIIVAEMNILPFVTPCKPPQYSLASSLPDLH